VQAIAQHLDKIAQQLPISSIARLYANLSRSLVLQLNKNVAAVGEQSEFVVNLRDTSSTEWWPKEGFADVAIRPDGVVPASSDIEQLVFDIGWNFSVGGSSNDIMFPQY
jgi:hypothetical protein